MKLRQSAHQYFFSFLKTYKIILYVLFIGLGFWHMQTAAFRYVINKRTISVAEMKTAPAIAIAYLVYIILSLVFTPNYFEKIKTGILRMLTYEQAFLWLLMVWYVADCVIYTKVTGSDYFRKNRVEFYDVIVNALILFPLAKTLRKEKAKKVIEFGLFSVLFSYSCFTIYCLWHVCRLDFVRMPSKSWIWVSSNPMKLELGNHYNPSASYLFLMLMLCLFFMTQKNKALKIFAFLLFPVHLFASLLSNSRTVYITGLLILPLFVFFYLWNRIDHKNLYIRFLLCLLAAGLSFGIYRQSRPFSFYLYEKVSHYNEIMLKAEDGTTQSVNSVRKIEKNLNGRRQIWAASLRTMTYDPSLFIFGATPIGVRYALLDPGGMTSDLPHAHNIILQVGVSFGVPIMILYCIFLLRIFLRSFYLLFCCRQTEISSLFVIPIIVFGLMIQGITEIPITHFMIMCSVFHLISGWELELCKENRIREEFTNSIAKMASFLKKGECSR